MKRSRLPARLVSACVLLLVLLGGGGTVHAGGRFHAAGRAG